MQVFGFAAVEEGDLSKGTDVRLGQALRPEWAACQRTFVPSERKKNRGGRL